MIIVKEDSYFRQMGLFPVSIDNLGIYWGTIANICTQIILIQNYQ